MRFITFCILSKCVRVPRIILEKFNKTRLNMAACFSDKLCVDIVTFSKLKSNTDLLFVRQMHQNFHLLNDYIVIQQILKAYVEVDWELYTNNLCNLYWKLFYYSITNFQKRCIKCDIGSQYLLKKILFSPLSETSVDH